MAAVAASSFLLDRVSKEAARHVLEGEPFACIIRGLFFVGYSTNSAGFFDAFSGVPEPSRPVVFGLATATFAALVVYWMWRAQKQCAPGVVHSELRPLALVLGGIVGNGFDRVAYGHVIDCAYLVLPTRAQFNVADVAILCGIGWVIVLTLFPRSRDASQDRGAAARQEKPRAAFEP